MFIHRKKSLWAVNTFLICCTIIMFIVTVFLTYKLLNNEYCNSYRYGMVQHKSSSFMYKDLESRDRLAVLVPYRNRFEELLKFAPYMHKFLSDQGVVHHIFILNQVDSFRFNRASLINVGYLSTKEDFNYIAMHDVDLLPLNEELKYSYPSQPHHVAAPDLHPRYHYEKFIGGILLINREQYALVNGLSNRYWGWGLEDDEFYVRLKDAQLNITRPKNISTNKTNTFRHIHDKTRKRDTVKCYNQKEVTRKRDRITGLHDVKFNIISRDNLTINSAPITVINIHLFCDKDKTPWCECEVK